ncbi:hypothetical protein LUZ61_016071 [Rhynchospora tenuis]|uniref:NB-ARC domain-containing protein n=1 Tax=Rhynchospora tenuis TaxID=198213 RepID=A0AAD5Z4T1_9POAL|nr:hypothetical protein LUZ61_016071 [Rhynchospora tenuis]
MLVLDDLWDKDLWLLLNNAFSSMNIKSRVVITTRRKDIASLADTNCVIHLQNLTYKDARDLLFKETFSVLERAEYCSVDLLNVAEEFVSICGGWPLAIVSIAHVLKSKIDKAVWTSLKNELHMHMNNNPTLKGLVDAFSLSFNDLPSHLKNCFLHCSIVPVIKTKWVIKLWAAEGFITEVGETKETMEELAMQCIKEVVDHCLLEVIDCNSDGEPKRLQMIQVVRVIALNMAVKEKFGTALSKDYHNNEIDCRIRRVSIWDCEDNLRLPEGSELLRSFILFGCKKLERSIINVLSTCRLLRVLCLRGTKITTLPSCIAELFNLHYLDLRHSEVKYIPISFEKLEKLEMLDLRCCVPVILPLGLPKLHKLRHLLLRTPSSYHDPYFLNDTDTCALKNLQTLKGIVATKDAFQLVNLKQLRSLSVLVPGINEYARVLWESLAQLNRLTSLEIVYEKYDELVSWKVLSNLAKLHFVGKIIQISSEFFNAFPKLNVLMMTSSELVIDHLPFFSGLSNLVELWLNNAYRGSGLTFRKDWFPKLKRLVLAEMEQPISIHIEEGTMQSLHILELSYIKQLKEVPKGLIYLTSLSKLFICEVPQVSEEKLQVVYRGAHKVPKIDFLSDPLKGVPSRQESKSWADVGAKIFSVIWLLILVIIAAFFPMHMKLFIALNVIFIFAVFSGNKISTSSRFSGLHGESG